MPWHTLASQGERTKQVQEWVGHAGVPPKLVELFNSTEKQDKMARLIAIGMSKQDISRAMGLSRPLVGMWLNRGEAEQQEGNEESLYATFYCWYHQHKQEARAVALEKLFESKDPKWISDWLTRTDDEMEYYKRDMVAGRSQTNVQILNSGAQGGVASGLARAREKFAGREVPELPEPDSLPALPEVGSPFEEGVIDAA